jgi:ribonuclease HI
MIAGGFEFEPQTPTVTNNQMEAMAALAGLQVVKGNEAINVITDSTYVEKGLIALRYKRLLQTNTWLWENVQKVFRRNISVTHVKGHGECAENEWCDQMAGWAANQQGIGVLYDEYVDTIPEAIVKRTERRQARKAKATERVQSKPVSSGPVEERRVLRTILPPVSQKSDG